MLARVLRRHSVLAPASTRLHSINCIMMCVKGALQNCNSSPLLLVRPDILTQTEQAASQLVASGLTFGRT